MNIDPKKLSKRQTEICDLLLTGNSTSKIAKDLCLKANTVSTVKKIIFYKTNTNNLIELYEIFKNI